MTRLHLIPILFLAVTLLGLAQDNPPPGIAFSPGAGTVEPGQSVSVTATGTWPSPPTIFCTTDGSPANIAAILVGSAGSGGGSISVLVSPNQTSETLNCVAALGAVTYQKVNESDSGWKICIGNISYASNGTPTATCTGGVGDSYPASWNYSWGPTMTEQMTGGDNVQILAEFSAEVCPLCDQPEGTEIMMAQSKTVMATADSSALSNNEVDMQAADATNTIGGVPVEHNFGLQCEQSSPASNPGYWAIDGTGAWVPTTISDHCPWPVNTPFKVVAQGWWTLGDTGCGGNGCFNVISLTINGTVYDLSGTVWESGFPAGTLAQPGQPGWTSIFGIQDQMDLTSAGGTAGRAATNANVTEAYYTPNPITASATFTPVAPAGLVSPTLGTTLPGPAVTFNWTAAAGATGYRLLLGSTQGANDLYGSGTITATSATATGLPTNGETVYATLYTEFGSVQPSTGYTFVAATQATLTSPTVGTVLAGPMATFNWTAAPGATGYRFLLGTTPGSNNLYGSGPTTATSVTVHGLPANGETIYATLYTTYGSAQVSTGYTFTAATQATLISPTDDAVLTGPLVTFNWTTAPGATGYNLRLGTTQGANNIYGTGVITATTATPTRLPTNGETIYAELITDFGTVSVSAYYVFTASTP
jgi:hypothetical protein